MNDGVSKVLLGLWGTSLLLVAYEVTAGMVNDSTQGGHGDTEALLAMAFGVFASAVGLVVGVHLKRTALVRFNTVGLMFVGAVAPILVAVFAALVFPVTQQLGRPYFCSAYFRSTHHSPRICELCTPGRCGG